MRPWRFNICYSTCHSSSTAYSITTGKLLHSASLLTHPGDGFTLNYGLHVLELFERFWKEHLPGKTPIFIHILQYLASKTVVFCRFPSNQSIGRFLENVAHNPFERPGFSSSKLQRFPGFIVAQVAAEFIWCWTRNVGMWQQAVICPTC